MSKFKLVIESEKLEGLFDEIKSLKIECYKQKEIIKYNLDVLDKERSRRKEAESVIDAYKYKENNRYGRSNILGLKGYDLYEEYTEFNKNVEIIESYEKSYKRTRDEN